MPSFDAGNNWTREQREALWCTVVGLAQHYATSHVAQHYCNPDESFDPQYNNTPPTFKEKVLRRVLEFDNWLSGKKEGWWEPGTGAAPVLGSAFGSRLGLILDASRGDCIVGRPPARRERGVVGSAGRSEWLVLADLVAITALCKTRTDDVLELKQLLDSLQKPETGSEPARTGPA